MAATKLSSVHALIFDLDGTLIDSKQDLIRSVNAMLVEMGRESLHEDTVSSYIGHGAPRLVARALGNRDVLFMRSHGPMVVGTDIGRTFFSLYYGWLYIF